jgi:hypothetical protein
MENAWSLQSTAKEQNLVTMIHQFLLILGTHAAGEAQGNVAATAEWRALSAEEAGEMRQKHGGVTITIIIVIWI